MLTNIHIEDTWIGISMRNIAKEDVLHHTLMASWVLDCLK